MHRPLRRLAAASFFSLGALFGCFAIAAGCSSSSSDGNGNGNPGSDDGLDAFIRSACVDPSAITGGSYRPDGLPDTAVLAVQQHVKVGACEAYILYFFDRSANAYWHALTTNCQMHALMEDGGYVPNNGFPSDCLVKSTAIGPTDPFTEGTNCVCCAGGECGRFCHPRPFDSGRGGLICKDYNNDFTTPLIDGDPRNHPDLCDCSGF